MVNKKYFFVATLLLLTHFFAVGQKDSTSLPILKTGWYFVAKNNTGIKMKLDKDTLSYSINPEPILTAKNIKTLQLRKGENGNYYLLMKFDEQGTDAWYHATRISIGSELAFILDNNLLYTPKVNSEITGGIAILQRLIYTSKKLEEFKNIIEAEISK